MNGFIRLMVVSAMIATLTSCASQGTRSGEDLSMEDGLESSADVTADDATLKDEVPADGKEVAKKDDFADFDEATQGKQAQAQPPAQDADLSLDGEQSKAVADQNAQGTPSAALSENEVSPTDDPFANSSIADAPAPTPQAQKEEVANSSSPAPESVPEPAPEAPMSSGQQSAASLPPSASSAGSLANIVDLKFKANENGGTIVVSGDRPLNYTTRVNSELHQYVVEVENAILPNKLKRSLNTRDIKGAVGAIDAYQNPGSTTARFVIQMREGVTEPTVQVEGSSLLIVAAGTPSVSAPVAAVSSPEEESVDSAQPRILSSQNLTEFLAGNHQFYGKKISIETNSMDIRDVLNFITEESGVNMVLSDEVKGNVSLKLRQVPWDQALVVLMRARKLGYTRQGNVLRISPLADLKAEEEDATKLAAARKSLEPLKVRMFSVSYAKVDELEKKIKDFLGERGKVVGDMRTNALVVTDIEENLDRIAKLISGLDTQPQQVLIEGKIVEAQEDFTRSIGVNWSSSGTAIKLGSSSRGPVNMTPSFAVNRTGAGPGSNLAFNLGIGTLDVFGSITAALALSESENKVKVLASPRIFTMSNEKADINQTTEVPVKQVTVNGNATQTSFQFKPLTLKLEVTPQVTSDGSVIMKVGVNRQFQGAIVDATLGSFSVNSREANTRVLVKNGQTAVIGGIYQSDATDAETGVPWVREVPIVGWLFKTKTVTKLKTELLIFLTPRIMGQVDGSAAKDL